MTDRRLLDLPRSPWCPGATAGPTLEPAAWRACHAQADSTGAASRDIGKCPVAVVSCAAGGRRICLVAAPRRWFRGMAPFRRWRG